MPKWNIRVDITGGKGVPIRIGARDYNFVRLTNSIYTNQNLSKKSKHIKLSGICHRNGPPNKRPSSSSWRTASTDFPDPLSPLVPIIHRSRQVFQATTCISTELLQIGRPTFTRPCEEVHRSTSLMSSSLISPAVSRISGLSNFDGFRDVLFQTIQFSLSTQFSSI